VRKIPLVIGLFVLIVLCDFTNAYSQTYEGEQIPITPYDVMARTKNMREILEWSRNKHLVVKGPPFYGVHHIYIDGSLKHLVILLKDDLTTHVFIGIPTHAEEWRKYDNSFNLLFKKPLSEKSFEWKVYKDLVLYKDKMLPPKTPSGEPYWGKVIAAEEWNGSISDKWIVSKIKQLYQKK
jgi:hypothetical protein